MLIFMYLCFNVQYNFTICRDTCYVIKAHAKYLFISKLFFHSAKICRTHLIWIFIYVVTIDLSENVYWRWTYYMLCHCEEVVLQFAVVNLRAAVNIIIWTQLNIVCLYPENVTQACLWVCKNTFQSVPVLTSQHLLLLCWHASSKLYCGISE